MKLKGSLEYFTNTATLLKRSYSMYGKFIVIEGIDGAGTTTQSEMLFDYFICQNIKSHLTYEPSSGPIGNLIREIFKGRILVTNDELLFDKQLAYLFAADRHDHLYNPIDGIENILSQNINVICTRYFFSSYVYHSRTKKEREFLYNLNKEFRKPDLIIYLDNPIEVSMERMSNRMVKDTYENFRKLKQVKDNYDTVIEEYNGNVTRILADQPVNIIHQKIVNAVLSL
ncbi:dTMP kinase [Ignatzschineria cameli]|uniref:Thymidylate kinase n=2 Tax=Ignatzschineria cameli TaxID=2182793 RepID=A0A2U2ATC5_9GAMM|nr:dTMP kinase [Ignatzschineria cameli]PWD90443.1 dTMP kinase [Ignatzschineria cameli]PWD92327.1 dTMP kinase [Ignatzschineria cameli]PWD93120.1 dTMP kinase [Ignatzschineria cameli]